MNNNTHRPHDKIVNAVDSNKCTRLKLGHRSGVPVVPSTCDNAAGEVVNPKPSNTVDLLGALADSDHDIPPAPSACVVPSTCDDAAGEVINPKPSNTVDLLDTLVDSNPDTPPAPSACVVPSTCDDAAG